MKILYFSCHEVLHADECSLFMELGHEVFCPGAAVCDGNRGDQGLRPGLPKCTGYDDLMAEWHTFGKAGFDNKERVSADFFNKFDICIVMHIPSWISSNWAEMKKAGIPVVWRTIGQSVRHNEAQIAPFRQQGLKIVRYSPREEYIPGYIGGDAVIRFYKNPDEFKGWTGEDRFVVTVAQSMAQRGLPCNYAWFKEVTAPFPRKLYGAGSESDSFGQGRIPFDELKEVYRKNRVYFYTGTYPASVTLNGIESLMSGIPLVAIGPQKGHPHGWFPDHDLYEMHEIIKNGENGFWSDSKAELQAYIQVLLDDHVLAQKISTAGRARAIELFGKDTVARQWDDFFNSLNRS